MLLILILFGIIYISTLATYSSLVAAGVDKTKALLPFINTMEWVRIIGRPKYQAFVVYIPIFNFFLLFSFFTDLSRCFGKTSFSDYFKAMVLPILHFQKIPKEAKYLGTINDLPAEGKSTIREWSDSILFAVLAATLIRWSTFEAFMIPTSSMEGTLMVGDYLFVSKLHYGPRSPITPLQVPLTHQNLWFTGKPDGTGGTKSYTDLIELPYFRFPGLTKIERNDIVVFNWPWDNGKDTFAKFNSLESADLRPTDLKTNYVKRCVAVAGDTLMVKDENIYINGEISAIDGTIQHKYEVEFDIPFFISKYSDFTNETLQKVAISLCDKLDIRVESGKTAIGAIQRLVRTTQKGTFYINMSAEKSLALEKAKIIKSVTKTEVHKGEVEYRTDVLYPAEKSWTLDDYGPIVMPKKGMTIEINKANLIMFQRALDYFEGDNVRIGGELTALLVDGKPVKEYTFKQNYYYMIGDNRHGSYDSRTWGFVPEDHIVGTPMLVWLSLEDHPERSLFERIRWERIFKWVM